MRCPQCATDNPAAAKFCFNCGSSLKATCPQCATEVPPGAKFCSNCGHRLAPSDTPASPTPPAPVVASAATPTPPTAARPPQARINQYIPTELLAKLEAARASGGMLGERRIVTMLFCDVQGSTAAAEKLDPEEWADIMNGAFEHLIAPVYKYEGTLARLMGDAILAFFGAPIAHEDDPQRAILAGLEIHQGIQPYREKVRQHWGLDFNVRVGINTGLVVVGEVGSDLRVEYTALGDAVNLAARMEQTAKPGTVQIAEDTHRLVAPLFDFEDLGPMPVKGKAEPVRVYRTLRAKAVPGSVRGIQGLDSPLVGRHHELDLLLERVRGLQSGVGQIVSVTGEAGLGKSRLVAEARRALAEEGLVATAAEDGAVEWHEARTRSFETSTPFAPFIDLFTGLTGIRSEEPPDVRYSRLRSWLADLGEGAAEAAPYLATMLGVPPSGSDLDRVKYLDPPQVRAGIFQSVRDVLRQLAATKPRVVVFEDLHWADPTSLALVEQLMPLPEQVSMLLMGVFRPNRQDASWKFHETANATFHHLYTAIALEPLDAANSRQLVANLLHVEDLPDRVRALILEKAEGNPFFVEEVIRSLLDAGLVVREDGHWKATREIERIQVPSTLAGVITARLDRISEESRRVAQTAAVVGRDFSLEALEQFHERQPLLNALVDLQRRELVRERGRIPRRIYSFKHALTQETVYASILMSRRRELHLKLAEWLEKSSPEQAAEIARNFVEAREPARALPYLVAAGEKAARSYSSAEAIKFFAQALEVAGQDCDTALVRRAYEGLGGAYTLLGKPMEALETYGNMAEYAASRDDIPMRVSALNKTGFINAVFLGNLEEAERVLVESEALARPSGERPGLVEMHTVYCMLRTSKGQFDDAYHRLSEAAEIGQDLNLVDAQLFGMAHLANTMNYMTRFADARQMAQRALDLAREHGDRRWESDLLCQTIPTTLLMAGEFEGARRALAQGMEIAGKIGNRARVADACLYLGMIDRLTGDLGSAIRQYRRILDDPNVYAYQKAAGLSGLSATLADISPETRPQAVQYQAQALETMVLPMGDAMGTMILADAGFSWLALGDLDKADESFRRGLSVLSALRLLMRPQLLIGSALVSLQRGDVDQAAAALKEARAFAEERAMRPALPAIAVAEGLLLASRDPVAGLRQVERAEADAHELGMRPLLWRIRASAAHLLEATGNAAEGARKRDQAVAIVRQVASTLDDEDLRGKHLAFAGRMLGRDLAG